MKVDATAQVGSGIEAYKGTFEWKINEETLIPPTPGEVASGDTTPIKTLADFYSKDSKVEFDLKTGSKLEYQDSDFSIPPDIAGGWDCWAVGIAIMKSWKEAGPYSVQETMRSVGDDFYALWNAHEIASSTDMDVIARRLGMETGWR